MPILVLAAFLAAAQPSPAHPPETMLERLSRVAELYRDRALGFACTETITVTGPSSRRVQFGYVFIKDETGRLRDYRTWKSGATAKDRGKEVDPRDYKIDRYLASAYLWVFVFRSDRQPLYRYRLVGEDEVFGRHALEIEFIPKGPIIRDTNDWAGFAWIDAATSQVLRFETYSPLDWNARVQRGKDLDAAPTRDPHDEGGPYEIERIVTDFDQVKNGMRFPSHVELETTRSTVVYGQGTDALRERTLVKVTQDYSGFQFFTIRSVDAIQKFVDEGGELPEAR